MMGVNRKQHETDYGTIIRNRGKTIMAWKWNMKEWGMNMKQKASPGIRVDIRVVKK